jgi:uncharacterized membrane protein (Fun14 family)
VDEALFPTWFPWVQQAGFGALAGFAAGYAMVKLGKLVALIFGLFFLALQVLAWFGFVSIDWLRIQNEVEPWLERATEPGAWEGVMTVLTYNLPFAASFVPGVMLGMRRG